MNKELEYSNIKYFIRESSRSKYISLKIDSKSAVIITVPKGKKISEKSIENVIADNQLWILKNLEKIEKKKSSVQYNRDGDYKDYKDLALVIVKTKIEYFNSFYNYSFNNISIRDQKTKWGSCSSSGNLSFNYRICFLPDNLSDYIVVHELCHLKILNHSKYFWQKVEESIPNYRDLRKNIKEYSYMLVF